MLTKGFLSLILVCLFAFISVEAWSQCAMCRAALESQADSKKAEAVNDGIVYLMVFPYLLVGVIGFWIYQLNKKRSI
jgi:hypothetical protein